MEKYYSVIQTLFNEECSMDCFKSNLAFVEEMRLFSSQDNHSSQQRIVLLINTALHGSEGNRFRALCLLDKCLKQCSADVFAANAILWMLSCTRWSHSTLNMELKVLRQLISLSVGNTDLRKQMNTLIFPKIFECLNKCECSSRNTILLMLSCLQVLLENYSSSCGSGSFRNYLHKYIMYVLKHHAESENITLRASQCLASFYHCGGGGHSSVNHKEAWSSNFERVLATYQKLLEQLYGSIETQRNVDQKSEKNIVKELLELKEEYLTSPTMRCYGLRRNCYIVTCILRSMLLCKFPTSKSFHVETLLNLICHILSVTCITLQNACLTNDIIALCANIGFMHGYAFDLLQALIISGKKNLIAFSTLICKLCIQSLKWTSSFAHSHEAAESFRCIRKKAYSTLRVWLTVAGSSSAIEIFVDELVPHVISDIECDKRAVTLLTEQPKGKMKRKRGQCAIKMTIPSEDIALTKSKSICQLAHENLQLIFSNSSIYIKWEHHKNLQILVISELLDMMKYNSQHKYSFPYSDWKCRLMLYKSLYTLFTEPHPKWLTPTSHLFDIFNAGISDSQIQISRFCREVSSTIEASNHPKARTLCFENEISFGVLPGDEATRVPNNLQHRNCVETENFSNSGSGFKDAHIVNDNKATDISNQLASAHRLSNSETIEEVEITARTEVAISLENSHSTTHDRIRSVNEIPEKEFELKKKRSEHSVNVISSTISKSDSDVCIMLEDFVDVVI